LESCAARAEVRQIRWERISNAVAQRQTPQGRVPGKGRVILSGPFPHIHVLHGTGASLHNARQNSKGRCGPLVAAIAGCTAADERLSAGVLHLSSACRGAHRIRLWHSDMLSRLYFALNKIRQQHFHRSN